MARFLQYVGLLGLLPVAWCRIGYDLRPTQTNFATDQFDFEWGWTPMPTSAPRVLGGLQRRQQQQYAPNATCGFVGGIADHPFGCVNTNLYCGFNSGYDAAGCCSGWTYVNEIYTLTACDFFTTCYDYTESAECDLSCQANTHVLACTNAAEPYCLTGSWTDALSGYTLLGCDASSGITDYLAITINAPSGGSTTTTSPPGVVIPSSTTTAPPTTTLSTTRSTTLSTTVSTTPVVFTTPSTSSSPGTSTSSTTTPSSSSTSLSPTSSALGPIQSTTSATSSSVPSTSGGSDPIVVTTITVSNGPSAGTTVSTITAPTSSSGSSSPQNTSNPSPSKSSSNTGAIAGGVVGGVAILALAAFLLWFCLRRRRNRNTTAEHAGPPIQEVSQYTSRVQSPYSGGPVSPVTQGPSQYGSPEQVHEFPAAAAAAGGAAGAAGMYGRSHPTDHPQSGYQLPGQYQYHYGPGQPVERAHEVSSEGTGTGSSGRPLNPNPNPYGGYNTNTNPNAGYAGANAPEVVQQQQGGYRGLDATGGGYNHSNANANASYGADPGFYGRPYSEMP